MSAGRPRGPGERRGSGGGGRIWTTGGGGGASAHGSAASGASRGGAAGAAGSGGASSTRRDLQVTGGGAAMPSRDSRPHSAPNSSIAAAFHSGAQRDAGGAGRDRMLAGDVGGAGQNGIEARLGIVKKNRRSNSSGIPGPLEALDLTKDDSSESRRRIAEYIGRYSTLHRSNTDTLRREGRASTPDGSGRTRARANSTTAVDTLHGLEVYEVGEPGASTLPARLRGTAPADAQRSPATPGDPGAPADPAAQRAELCPAAVETPSQGGAAVGLQGFVHAPAPADWGSLAPLLDTLFGEAVAGELSAAAAVASSGGSDTSLWSHLLHTASPRQQQQYQ